MREIGYQIYNEVREIIDDKVYKEVRSNVKIVIWIEVHHKVVSGMDEQIKDEVGEEVEISLMGEFEVYQ